VPTSVFEDSFEEGEEETAGTVIAPGMATSATERAMLTAERAWSRRSAVRVFVPPLLPVVDFGGGTTDFAGAILFAGAMLSAAGAGAADRVVEPTADAAGGRASCTGPL
jgi:hypothetical protein